MPTRGSSDGQRLHPDFGPRHIRTSQGNSSYHAMQWRVDRRFARGFQVTASYTWSRNIDSTSEGVGASHYTRSPRATGRRCQWRKAGLKLDRGPSDFDRTHRFTVLYVWDVPRSGHGFWKYALAGGRMAGITSFQSGAPFTVPNGFDRNNDGRGVTTVPTSAIRTRLSTAARLIRFRFAIAVQPGIATRTRRRASPRETSTGSRGLDCPMPPP